MQEQNTPEEVTQRKMTPITLPMNQPFATANRTLLFHWEQQHPRNLTTQVNAQVWKPSFF